MQQNETETLAHHDLFFERQHQYHLSQKNKKFSEYMQRLEKSYDTNVFTSCTSWNKSSFDLESLVCQSDTLTQKGGYFLRYNQTGVAINPSHDFLQTFSSLGFHLWHIDAVVVTHFSEEIMTHLKQLYQRNKELNHTLLSKNVAPHVIRYFLHPQAFINYAKDLRPTFKEERESIVCLDTFESQEAQKISDSITMCYTTSQDLSLQLRFDLENGQSVGIALHAASLDEKEAFFAPSFFASCSMLVTKPLASFVPSEKMSLVLVGDFDASKGDTRLEEVKRMRCTTSCATCSIFPMDEKLMVDLDSLTFRLDDARYAALAAHELAVIRTGDFAPLTYVAVNQML